VMRHIRHGALPVAGCVGLFVAACGGPGRYVQEDRPPASVCEAGTQPAVVGLQGREFTNVWSCLTSCPPGREYVSTITMYTPYRGEVKPECQPACRDGWARKMYAGHGVTMQDVMTDVCKARSATDCEPVSEDAKAEDERQREACEGGRQLVAERNRAAHPGQACMSDCVTEAQRCVSNCNGLRLDAMSNMGCKQNCQASANACTARCQGMAP